MKDFIFMIIGVISVCILALVPFAGSEQSNLSRSIEIESGTVTVKTDDGSIEIDVGSGTFIPEPANKELAKRIVDLNSEINELNIKIESLKKKLKLQVRHSLSREEKINDHWKGKVRSLEVRLEESRNWWNEWGKVTFTSLISAGVASAATAGVYEFGGCRCR